MSTIEMSAELQQCHQALAKDVRDKRWTSNCAGEIFLLGARGRQGVRIGHFQGDAALAAFAVQAHNDALDASREASAG